MLWLLIPDMVIRIILPSIIMLLCNIIILVTVCKSRRTNDHHLGSVTAMLLFVTFFHLTLIILPYILIAPYMHLYSYSTHILYTTIWCLVYIDQSFNFLLYSISRRDVKLEMWRMFKCNNDDDEVTNKTMTEMDKL